MRINHDKDNKHTYYVHILAADHYDFLKQDFFISSSQRLKPLVEALRDKFVLVMYNKQLLASILKRDRSNFIEQLMLHFNEEWANGYKDSENYKRLDLVVVYISVPFKSCLCNFLVSVKAYLDVFAGYICKSTDPNAQMAFKKAKVNRVELSGGKLINWLRHSAPNTFQNRQQLSDLLHQHSMDWITDVVNCRDAFAHHHDIKGYEPLAVLMKDHYPPYDESMLYNPSVEKHGDINAYVNDIACKLDSWSRQIFQILPREFS